MVRHVSTPASLVSHLQSLLLRRFEETHNSYGEAVERSAALVAPLFQKVHALARLIQ